MTKLPSRKITKGNEWRVFEDCNTIQYKPIYIFCTHSDPDVGGVSVRKTSE